MRYGSVCSGIEAATAAWHHMGWEPAFFSEIEKFPRAVLEHHYPEVPLHGDFTTIEQNQYGKIDLLVGGTPCQSFSIAGLRGGLDDDRGNLALEFCRLAQREQPRWIVWENVPGVLSSSGGRDFGSILGALEDLGYGLAYRVLDAQYFGVAQRRRRVFVVGYLGDWRPAAAVLFERHSMPGHPAPSREARKEAARAAAAGTGGSGGAGRERPCVDTFECGGIGSYSSSSSSSPLLRSGADLGAGCEALIIPEVANASTFNGSITGQVAATFNASSGDANHSGPKVMHTTSCIAFPAEMSATQSATTEELAPALSVKHTTAVASYIAFDTTQTSSPHNYSNPKPGDPCHPLAAGAHPPAVAYPIDTQNMTEGHASGGKGFGEEGDPSFTLTKGHSHAVACCIMPMNSGKDYKARETEVSQPIMAGGPVGGNQGGDFVLSHAIQAGALRTNPSSGPDGVGVQADLAYTLEARSEVQAVAFQPRIGRNGRGYSETVFPALNGADAGATSDMRPCVAFAQNTRNEVRLVGGDGQVVGALAAQPGMKQTSYIAAFQPTEAFTETTPTLAQGTGGGAGHLYRQKGNETALAMSASAVRRLTPVECERLQGFPDGFTAIPWGKKSADECPDGPRYKALGNSMAVPVMRWIGERIQLVDDFVSLF